MAPPPPPRHPHPQPAGGGGFLRQGEQVAVAETPEQVVEILDYVINGALAR